MKEPKTFTVDGDNYTIVPFLTSRGMKLLTRISTLIGAPALQMAFQTKGAKSVLEMDLGNDDVAAVVQSLFSKIEPDTIDTLFKEILAGTQVNGSKTCAELYDTHFQGQYKKLFIVVWKSLEGQYGDFLGALGGSLSARLPSGLKAQ